MFTITESKSGKYVHLLLSGKLNKEAYAEFVPDLEAMIAKHGKVRLLVELKDFHGWDLEAIWEDTKFGFKHYRDIERIAIVGESAWEKWMVSFCRPFTSAKMKYFDAPAMAAAEQWIHKEHIPLHHQLNTETGVLILHPDDKLSKEDFVEVAKEIDPYIEEHGKLNGVMIELRQSLGWEKLSDMIAHFKFIRDHHKDIKRVAVVSDEESSSLMPSMVSHFVSAEVKHFSPDDKAVAAAWLAT